MPTAAHPAAVFSCLPVLRPLAGSGQTALVKGVWRNAAQSVAHTWRNGVISGHTRLPCLIRKEKRFTLAADLRICRTAKPWLCGSVDFVNRTLDTGGDRRYTEPTQNAGDEDMTTTTTTVTCYKCNGARYFDKFAHIVSGVCFTCGGAGVVDIDSSKLGSCTGSTETANDYYSQRPYTVVCDGAECISVTFKTWEAARDWLGDGMVSDCGQKFRIAKWDGKCMRYRDGSKVKMYHHQ
jgi:hypothetical protein